MNQRMKFECIAFVCWAGPSVVITTFCLLVFGNASPPIVKSTRDWIEIGRVEEFIDEVVQQPFQTSDATKNENQSIVDSPPSEPVENVAIESNSIEPELKPKTELTEREIEQVIARYRQSLEEGQTEIRIGRGDPYSNIDWLGNRFVLNVVQGLATAGVHRTIVDRRGLPARANSNLVARVDLHLLPFNAEQIAMSLLGSRSVEVYVVLFSDIELELYRSLFRYLNQQGLEMPRTDWTYEASVRRDSSTGNLDFVWTDRTPFNIGE